MATQDERKKAVADFKRKVLRKIRRLGRDNASWDTALNVLNALEWFVLAIDERDQRTPGGLKGRRR